MIDLFTSNDSTYNETIGTFSEPFRMLGKVFKKGENDLLILQ